jgi:murein DD-endopeptidase MepM/ murein hydrolase activator NlpD
MKLKAWNNALVRFWKARGFYALTALCLILIAGAAVYARTRLIHVPAVESDRASAQQAAAQASVTAQPTVTPAPLATPKPAEALNWPVSGRKILREYSNQPVWYEPLSVFETHPGVDIRAEAGEEVLSAADGLVASAGYDPQQGYMVEIRGEDGLVTRYGNLSKDFLVSPGDRVRRAQAIGKVGQSAPSAGLAGPFLHFEAFRGGARVALP